ncbi:unnamed protein product [Ambrosiozyma monospora]|uniref:Unnamed protein product n=1 Tax=Ambrosiozyma monospora TaxID=43982 RepID=A0ACB5TNK4_AMBMO|nr:unnamed protein product [Ambrosiozyma monospora]
MLKLLNIPNPTDWKDLKKNGSYYQKGLELGLINNDEAWVQAFKEHCSVVTLYRVVPFFIAIILTDSINDPRKFYNDCRSNLVKSLRGDYVRRYYSANPTDEELDQYLSYRIFIIHDLSSYNIQPNSQEFEEASGIRASSIKNYLTKEEVKFNLSTFNDGQKNIFIIVTNPNRSQKLFLINACGGSGKPYLINTMAESLKWSNTPSTMIL